MTTQATAPAVQPRNFWRSTGAIVLGFVAVVVFSLGTDEVLHLLKVYPPWGQPMYDPRLNLLALTYRIVYTVMGSYIAARFAPRNPMRHAIILGAIGFLTGVESTIELDGACRSGEKPPVGCHHRTAVLLRVQRGVDERILKELAVGTTAR